MKLIKKGNDGLKTEPNNGAKLGQSHEGETTLFGLSPILYPFISESVHEEINGMTDPERSTGFILNPGTWVTVNPDKGEDELFVNGVNLMAENLKYDPEFKDLSDDDIRIIVQAAMGASRAESTHGKGKENTYPAFKIFEDNFISSAPASAQRALGTLNKYGLWEALKEYYGPGYDTFNGDISQYYDGNARSYESVKKQREDAKHSGASVGLVQLKGSKDRIPIKYWLPFRTNLKMQDGVNAVYAFAKLFNGLKDKHLYFTNDILNRKEAEAFNANPDGYRLNGQPLSRGPEMNMIQKLAMTWLQGLATSDSSGQTALTLYDDAGRYPNRKAFLADPNRQINYPGYVNQYQLNDDTERYGTELRLLELMDQGNLTQEQQDKIKAAPVIKEIKRKKAQEYAINLLQGKKTTPISQGVDQDIAERAEAQLKLSANRQRNAEKAAAHSQAVDARLWQKNNIGMPVYDNPYLGLTDREKEVLKYQQEHPFTTPSEEYKALKTRINTMLNSSNSTTIYTDASRYTHANGGTLHLQYFR